ncbi:hypothetical protein PR202_gb09401 [Eleusine coracana subsp. coracana]|uniref:FLZ-type domain-containing protein n=1 Tax=Eleusine coracana subsp. coracana TaxID=191504 RepID=A0AAV5EFH8_ELECO|nr:hypothetical protein PR202_gb09401 [Eleusine coracana subsp. coracana]
MAGVGHLQMHFLDACFLCRKPLAANRDIYMYRFGAAIDFKFLKMPSLLVLFSPLPIGTSPSRATHACERSSTANRGDTAFCSEECRSAQIEADQAAERADRASARRPTHGPAPAREVDGPQECGKIRAGSVLAL